LKLTETVFVPPGECTPLAFAGKVGIAQRRLLAAKAVLAPALCTGLGACAWDSSWPTLGKVSDVENAMTPGQRQKAIEELQKGGQGQNGSASGSQAKRSQSQ
jgi:hypothetical protein